MFDIGFWELLVIGVVLLLVMGPERLPEVAKQAAFFIRKARQGVYRLRTEMQDEISGTPFADLEAAKREMADFKNDIKQFGRDLADSAQEKVGGTQSSSTVESNTQMTESSDTEKPAAINSKVEKPTAKKSTKKTAKKKAVKKKAVKKKVAAKKGASKKKASNKESEPK